MTVDDLYRIATDPDASQEQLRDAWNATKSTRVRKAVASNPNCDSATMCMAARLYLKEVIANPSFELLNLFQEDKFVKRIHEAYTDPAEFYKGTQLPSIRNTNGNRINLARALLVSPSLRSAKIVQDICATLSGAEFSRELKDPDVWDNVRAIVTGNLGYFGLSCLMFLMRHGVIDVTELGNALSQSPGPTLYYTPKGAYTKFVNNQFGDYQLLYRFMYVNRVMNVRDLIKEVRTDADLRTDDRLDTYAALFRDFLLHDVARRRAESRDRMSRYGWNNYRSLNDDDFSHHLSDLVWTTIVCRNMPEGTSFDDLDLAAIYRDVARVGFDRDFGPYKCEIKLGNVANTITSRSKMCEKLLALTDDNAFEFFVTSGMIWQEWYGKNDSGNLESQVVDRLHRINEAKFKSGKSSLLFRFSDLDYFPTISVSQRNGVAYDSATYMLTDQDRDGNFNPVPAGSGRIDPDVVEGMAVKGVG
jgi:hypothetical protein